MKEYNKLSIIIPVYNEESTVEMLIEKVKLIDIKNKTKEIIVINDGSNDGSYEILRKIKGIKLFTHDVNLGKGAAIKTGLRHVSGGIVIIQDADLEYDPNEIGKVIEPILDGRADFVYGSRILKKGNIRGGFFFYFGGRFVSLITSLLFFRKISDSSTCYKAFKSDLIKGKKGKEIMINSNGFTWEHELTGKLLKDKKNRFLEVPISYVPREISDGKKIRFLDGFKIICVLIKSRF
ncbi:glycosyltransferase family 2 protein [Candidatus Pacearchaeota archaeon]|nr:glycosyltransferase family 2 protein [Candidatus Pacearchaeota archaeon]